MKQYASVQPVSEWHMPPTPQYRPDRTVVARPIIEAEASWWEDGTRVTITVRREQMDETPEASMRHVQQIIDILLNG